MTLRSTGEDASQTLGFRDTGLHPVVFRSLVIIRGPCGSKGSRLGFPAFFWAQELSVGQCLRCNYMFSSLCASRGFQEPKTASLSMFYNSRESNPGLSQRERKRSPTLWGHLLPGRADLTFHSAVAVWHLHWSSAWTVACQPVPELGIHR